MKISQLVVAVIVQASRFHRCGMLRIALTVARVVPTPFGVVASSGVQASQADARLLERGGSALEGGQKRLKVYKP